jgi:zinc protease
VGGFVLRLDSNLALRESVASMAWNGRPLDYLDTWTQRMSQITRVDILRAFQRVLGHENWVSVVVGNSP